MKPLENIKFFILAGGFGKRTRPLSLVKPKPAFPLHSSPLINILLKNLKACGFSDGFVNLHYKPQAIRDCIDNYNSGLSIKYLYEEQLSGSKILARAADDMEEFLFILNGDVFFDLQELPVHLLLEDLKKSNADGTLLLRKSPANQSYSAIITENGFFKGIDKQSEKRNFMYTGIALFRKKVIQHIRDTNFFTSLAANDFKIKTALYNGTWLDIGNPALYFFANNLYKERCNDSKKNSLSPGVSISPNATVTNSIVWENTTITGNSTIKNCILTGNMSLDNVHFENKVIYHDGSQLHISNL
ncbi:MAG: NDP-sugar synthase [bacterium]|nr:NDP-sugar synthase [bacterium]